MSQPSKYRGNVKRTPLEHASSGFGKSKVATIHQGDIKVE